jgi:hypothetical protein
MTLGHVLSKLIEREATREAETKEERSDSSPQETHQIRLEW